MGAPDVDVVVAGGGAAGLAATLAAAQGGATVLLVEARATFRQGSNTAMSTSMIPAGGSRWQDEAGIVDSPERFRHDIMRKTGGQADQVISRALTDAAPELVAWLADDWNIPLELVTDFSYPGHSAFRCHAVPDRSGRVLHTHLLDRAQHLQRVDVIVPMRLDAVEELHDGEAVAKLHRPDGTAEEVTAGAVVLATNGYAANTALVRRHMPEIADGLYHGGDGSTGDALVIGESLGADTGFLDAYQGHGSVAVPHGILLTWAAVMHGGVLVNVEGRRFGDETVGYSEFGARVVSQPEQTAWLVMDERIQEACLPFADYQEIVNVGAVRRAEDRASLAELIGCPPEALDRTLDEVAAAASGAAPDPHGRTGWEGVLQEPYVVGRVTGALFHTQGGLYVDAHARVLRAGAPIPSVYAAGGAAVGISGHGAGGYLAGNGLLGALGLGMLAGRHAAQNAGGVDGRDSLAF